MLTCFPWNSRYQLTAYEYSSDAKAIDTYEAWATKKTIDHASG